MYKFFCHTKKDNYFELDLEQQKHLKVIRIKNEKFLVNYNKEFYLCNYETPNKAIINQKLEINNELDFDLVVAIPLIKQNHFEIAIQKAVELGATKIIPFVSKYCDKSNINVENKITRFGKIIKEAAQQSFRNIIPTLENTLSFEQVLNYSIENKILAYENETKNGLIKPTGDILLIVGPEGGFAKDEIALANTKKVAIVGLTRTILKAETALIYMISKII
ncbi:16S rRNA (uracil(1498)-N(3))-methyltransferase [Mycoplasma enhydrae]|uniref:16S rRNA (uracil(1498)-N(3))-methyltransferase n=1 Tax=Mycoplasma enhydrae TaxID=2499220 RepID=UPI0021E980F2|nr:16S rRNA (uracil(1498)-N(3))-methyltransferase [Mycoplasma enhydrae]MCV3753723.1 16S rRNA (uracil(1498)-N(3))-methyltransferase [Mycoplasma enhydrae]